LTVCTPKKDGPSIAPEKLLRALVVQMLYSVRSERLLVEEIDYNILFRWFVTEPGRGGLGRNHYWFTQGTLECLPWSPGK
jgi:hypothetical protein